mmetsp:Transcript_14645/g.30679  ORF Transcript_14645/g.30679 Transcript_14645/m.30679 type:complete len:213 (+) Transcript_14645:1075-1713(+)
MGGDGLLEAVHDRVTLRFDLSQEVHVDAARHRRAILGDAGVKHRLLDFLHCNEEAFRKNLPQGVMVHFAVVEATQEELRLRRLVPTEGGLCGEEDVRGGADLLMNALECVRLRHLPQLQQVHKRGPHVLPERELCPQLRLRANGEHGETRVPGGLRKRNADLAHASRLEHLCLLAEDLSALGEYLLQLPVGVVEKRAIRNAREGIPPHHDME